MGVIKYNDEKYLEYSPVIFRWLLHADGAAKLVVDETPTTIFRLLTANGFWMIMDGALILCDNGQIFSHSLKSFAERSLKSSVLDGWWETWW